MWKDEYRKLMFPVNRSDVKLEEAMRIKFKNIPPSLFKYRPVSNFSIDNLSNDTIRLTKATEFNDPYDCALQVSQENAMYDSMKDDEEHLKKITEVLKKHGIKFEDNKDGIENVKYQSYKDLLTESFSKLPIINGDTEKIESVVTQILDNLGNLHEDYSKRMISQFQKGTFVSCFSEEVNSILMWSHYAYNHTGICIEYNLKQCEENDVLTRCLHPVNYTNKLFDIADYIKKGKENLNTLFITYCGISKSMDWSYEKEWRLIFNLGSKNESFNRRIVKPKAIYLGAKISEKDKNHVIDIAKSKGISVFQMKMSSNEFKLVYDEVLGE
ncbi:DUF2971 domain-containing protein [Peribacillus sp. TH14]|uniref:DUF2971 domain-containing protein n=1 Tax=Peribacillus sp. TH14 TaxID=2798481 RepID=UPI00191225C5|nr:DUF2971 domain-containing protein [Peribacillus sp. TH14]MBK5497429.1 DUF2971 domain-containing protein [Peribacillus sp. TH14]